MINNSLLVVRASSLLQAHHARGVLHNDQESWGTLPLIAEISLQERLYDAMTIMRESMYRKCAPVSSRHCASSPIVLNLSRTH